MDEQETRVLTENMWLGVQIRAHHEWLRSQQWSDPPDPAAVSHVPSTCWKCGAWVSLQSSSRLFGGSTDG